MNKILKLLERKTQLFSRDIKNIDKIKLFKTSIIKEALKKIKELNIKYNFLLHTKY